MLSEKMEKALNEQLNAEFYSSYLYMSMANYCDENDLPGFAHWLRMQTQEEYTHANTFMTYIIDRDGHVELYQINQPDSEFKDIQDVFEKALAHEKFVTEQVNNLYALADKENDYATKIKMQWFIEEQVEEEKTFKEIIQQIKRIGGNNTALFLFDQKMNERQETPDTVQQ